MAMQQSILNHMPLLSEIYIDSVAPYVSTELINNTHRSRISYETARASGPGGQATNVTETQINAKLVVDEQVLYTAEAQDSRSALNNKESALYKLQTQKRGQFNEVLHKHHRYEETAKRVMTHLQQ
uniref:Peptide chain release factor 1-like, mitochondrial n=1 Tax=Lygus hesperus TaxID=30085 RepID=A0A0A9ZCY2_LYGHE